MTKTKAFLISLLAGCVLAVFLVNGNIAARLEQTQRLRDATRYPGLMIFNTPEQDTRRGIEIGLVEAFLAALLIGLALQAMVPIDEKRVIGKLVLDEAMETVKKDLPVEPAVEARARQSFWKRFDRVFGRGPR